MRNSIALVLSFAALFLAGCAKPISKAEAQKAIHAAYLASDTAISTKDLNGVFAVYSSDCVFVNKDGGERAGLDEKNRAEMQKALNIPGVMWKRTSTITEFALSNAKGTAASMTIHQSADVQIPGIKTMHIDAVSQDDWE
ncbi:MAG: hypothetical protein EON58_20110 [Alphaproteobacteria bacterium]|nr:MAG: hypothetical protein EON58_20110 [Alphaproteobacteria bacterium]